MPAEKILIVHYDPRSLERHRKTLEENGFEVHEARDGAAALSSLVEHEPDLVLIEAMLPKISGFEVCCDLKKTRRGKQTPIVVMTTVYKGRKYRNDAIHTYGADDYLELPLDDAQFIAALRRSLGGGAISGVEKGA